MEGSGYSFSRSGVAKGSRGGMLPARRHPEEESIHQIRRLRGHLFQAESAAILYANVAQLHVFHVVAGKAG